MYLADARRWLLPVTQLLIALTIFWQPPAAHADSSPTAGRCTPNGWSSPTRCMPPVPGAWVYQAFSLPFGSGVGAIPDKFFSLSALWAAILANYGTEQGCPATTLSSPAPMSNSPTTYWSGIVIQQAYQGTLTWYDFQGGSNCVESTPTVTVIGKRSIGCFNPDWQLTTAADRPVCACTSEKCAPPRCCREGGVTKGKPIDVLTGNEHYEEIDYSSSLVSKLEFRRAYNSVAPLLRGNTWLPVPLGVGWSGSYQQSIQYTETAEGEPLGLIAIRPDGSMLGFAAENGAFYFYGDSRESVDWRYDSGNQKIGFVYVTANDDREEYDLEGRLVSITSRGGIAQTLAYDSRGLLDSVTDPFGHSLQFDWMVIGSDPFIQKVTLPDGGEILYEYDGSGFGNLIEVTYPDGTHKEYLYELSGFPARNLLTGIKDDDGVQYAKIEYDNQRRAHITQLAGGVNKYTVDYTSATSRKVTDAGGAQHVYGASSFGGEPKYSSASATCAGCREFAEVSYDANGNFESTVDFKGERTLYEYDPVRNLQSSRTEAENTAQERTITTTWHPTYRLPASITEPTRTTTFTYYPNGDIETKTVVDTTVSPQVERQWSYTYDTYGRLLTEDGPMPFPVLDVTTWTYHTCATGNECGQLHTVTDAAGHVTTYSSYNEHGQPLTITDPNNVVTTLTYDARQRLESRTVAGETTYFSYWPTGLLETVTAPDLSTTAYTYDGAHRLVSIEDGAGNRIEYELDVMSNRKAERIFDSSNALKRKHLQTFNLLNQLQSSSLQANTAAVTTTFGYDGNGNQTTTQAPPHVPGLARSSSNEYDALNRLWRSTDPASRTTVFGYDAADNLTSVTDPEGLVTSYEFNGFGELRKQTSPDSGVTTLAYDPAGNLKTRIDGRGLAASRAIHEYDDLNRLTQVRYPDQTHDYTYDSCLNGVGRLCSIADASGTTSYEYDGLGRVTKKSHSQTLPPPFATHTRTVRYQYTNARLTRLTMPSGALVDYGYDGNGRVGSVTVTPVGGSPVTVASAIQYDPFGEVKAWTWANGSTATRQTDLDGRIIEIASAGTTSLTYDDASRITEIIAVSGNPGPSWEYEYDQLDRLTSQSRAGFSAGYTYDANGNRLTQTGSMSATYTYATTGAGALTSNRLQSVSGGTHRIPTYDGAGNVTSDANGWASVWSMGYDGAGRYVSDGSGNPGRRYNALGQRTFKSASVHASYTYDESGHALEVCRSVDYQSKCEVHGFQEYIWLGDIPIAAILPHAIYDSEGVETYFARELYDIHTDHLNTPRRLTRSADSSSTVVWRWNPDAFGVGFDEGDLDGDGAYVGVDLRFAGQLFDLDGWRHYNYFRDYDPYTGRYLQSDPLGLQGGVNTYSYAHGRPTLEIDPKGLFSLPTVTSWSYEQHLSRPGAGGETPTRVPIRCACTKQCDSWKVSQCSGVYHVRVLLLDNVSDPSAAAFFRKSEGQHVDDWLAGYEQVRSAGQAAEDRLRGMAFGSREECEAAGAKYIADAIRPVYNRIRSETIAHYDSGAHTWRSFRTFIGFGP